MKDGHNAYSWSAEKNYIIILIQIVLFIRPDDLHIKTTFNRVKMFSFTILIKTDSLKMYMTCSYSSERKLLSLNCRANVIL